MDYNIALVGGDLRSASLASMLAEDGCFVKTFGLSFPDEKYTSAFTVCKSIAEATDGCSVAVGPIPFSRDGGKTLNTPLYDKDIQAAALLEALGKVKIFIAGRIPGFLRDELSASGIIVEDVLERDDFAVLNSVPTAEGTVQIAMEELPATLWNMKVLVLGAGRVGRQLAQLLKMMGADVTVAVRKGKDAAWAVSNKMSYCGYDFTKGLTGDFRLICNTVPALVLDGKALSYVRKDALIIDLASDSGGVDYCYALTNGVKVIHALSLPGKVAPETAAENIKRVIYNIIAEDKKE